MTLSDIRKQLIEVNTQEPDEDMDTYMQRRWDSLPRIPFKELPDRLKKNVRERFTPDMLRDFLTKYCYTSPEVEAELQTMPPEKRKKIGFTKNIDAYVSFKTMTKDLNPATLDRILIHTRNIATYTIEDDSMVPLLYGNFAVEAFEKALDDMAANDRKHAERAKNKRKSTASRAADAQDKVSVGFYQIIPSDKSYQHALSPQQNKKAYIAMMDADFFKKLRFDDGHLIIEENTARVIKDGTRGRYEDIQNLDTPLLAQVYTAVYKAAQKQTGNEITVSIPEFCKEMGIDVRSNDASNHASDLFKKLDVFRNCLGVIDGHLYMALLQITSIDTKNQLLTFSAPYMMYVIRQVEKKSVKTITKRDGEEYQYTKPSTNRLIHSTIVNERNKPAVEIVYALTNGLLNRGFIPDAKTYRRKNASYDDDGIITYSVSYRHILNECPLLRGRIQSYTTNSNKNHALERAFKKAYQLLKKKTDALDYFKNLQYDEFIPRMTDMDRCIVMTFQGMNRNYHPKN